MAEDLKKNAEEYEKSKAETQARSPLPQVTFATFLLSLNTSALVHLGELPEPGSEETSVDLDMARHAIDTIAMLKEKTAGNLDEEEQRLMDSILFELRMLYIKKAG